VEFSVSFGTKLGSGVRVTSSRRFYIGKKIFIARTGGTHNYTYTMWPKGIDANVKPDGTYRNHWALKGLICVNNYIKRV